MNSISSRQKNNRTCNRILLSALLMVVSIFCFGQNRILLPSEEQNNVTNEVIQKELNNSKKWEKIRNLGWRAYWNESTKTPHRAWGPPIQIPGYNMIDADNVKNASLTFLKNYETQLGISITNLRLVRTTKVKNTWFVTFQQVHNDIPVHFSRVELRISDNAKVFLIGSDYYDDIRIDESDIIISELINKSGVKSSAPSEITTEILPIIDDGSISFHKVAIITDENRMTQNYVDFETGSIKWQVDLRCNAGSGIVSGQILEQKATDPLKDKQFKNMTLSINGEEFVTNSNGEFEFAATEPSTLIAQLKGPFLNIINNQGSDAKIEMTIEPDQAVEILWDDSNSTLAERNVFYHTNIAHDTLKSIDPNFTGMDFEIPINVNRASTICNAFYDLDGAINFDRGTSNCLNPAYNASIIYHEYAHAIYYKVLRSIGLPGTANQPANEAQADVFAAIIEDSPVIFPDVAGSGTVGRNLSWFKRYPQDVVSSVHITGLILGGAFWDLKTRTSRRLVSELAHFAKYGAPDGSNVGDVFKDWFIEVLIADDDDNNLGNGTPHYDDIYRAFANHGIAIEGVIDNTEAEILEFEIPRQFGSAEIDIENGIINIETLKDTDIKNLIPIFKLSEEASATVNSVIQHSGVTTVDFSNPVIYQVVAEDQINIRDWLVNVVEGDRVLGLNEKSLLMIYPNPSSDLISVKLEDIHLHGTFLTLRSIDGKVIIMRQPMEKEIRIDLAGLSPGVYHLVLSKNGRILSTDKVLKK